MPDQDVITVRVTDQTPPELRHLDGRTYPRRSMFPHPVPGAHGTFHGIPGTLSEDGQTWEIADRPLPRRGDVQLADLLTVLVEIRDLLRENATAQRA